MNRPMDDPTLEDDRIICPNCGDEVNELFEVDWNEEDVCENCVSNAEMDEEDYDDEFDPDDDDPDFVSQ